MRCLKLLLMGGIVLALTSPGWALSLHGYANGDPLVFHFNSVDVGPFYGYGQALTAAQCDALEIMEAAGLRPLGGGAKFVAGEDAYGIAYVTNITDPTNSTIYWDQATSTTELTSIFYGTRDLSVRRQLMGSGNDKLETYSDNFRFVLWEAPDNDGLQYNAGQGPEARTAADVYPTVSDGVKVLEAQGVPGYWNALTNNSWVTHKSEVTLVYDIQGNVIAVTGGSGHAFAEIADVDGDGVTDGLGFDNDNFATEQAGVTADIRLDWTLTMPDVPGPGEPTVGNAWWDLANQDPVQMTFVPEPVTMAGLLLGIGCLSRYVRRRR